MREREKRALLTQFRQAYLDGQNVFWPIGGRKIFLDPAQALALWLKPPVGDWELVMLVAGQGAGKSLFAPRWLIWKAQNADKRKAWMGAAGGAGGPLIEQVIMEKFKEAGVEGYMGVMEKAHQPTNARFNIKPDIHPNAHIIFRHLQEGLKIQGRHISALAVDEVDIGGVETKYQIPESAWKSFKERTQRNRNILFTTTPYRYDWVYRKVYRKSMIVVFRIYFQNSLGQYMEYEDWREEAAILMKNMWMGDRAAKRALSTFFATWKKRWAIRLEKPDQDLPYLSIVYPNILVPHYKEEDHIRAYIEAREDGNMPEFEMRQLARWVVSKDLLFASFWAEEEQKCLDEDQLEARFGVKIRDLPAYVGVDFGYTDSPHALAVVLELPDEMGYYVYLDYEGLESVENLAGRVISTIQGYDLNFQAIMVDSTASGIYGSGRISHERASIYDEFMAALAEYPQFYRSVQVGNSGRRISYENLRDICNQGRLYVHPNARCVIRHMGVASADAFSSATRTAHRYHALDAVRYVVWPLERERKTLRKKERLHGDRERKRRIGARGLISLGRFVT